MKHIEDFDQGETIRSIHSADLPPDFVPEFAPGTRFDDYELVEYVGRGGMGEIWLANEISGKRGEVIREVAIKFVPRDIAKAEEEMERVESMFRQVHDLNHEHICQLYRMKHTPGFGTYIVMKYIEGTTLAKFALAVRRQHGKFPLKTLLEILRPVAAALDYAHKKNVVHRDIKPGNIMVVGDPKTLKIEDVQIIDFGLAVTFRASMSRVSQQKYSIAGARPYMAPEQWRGKFQDAATDQYALGVTAYELLTGVFPFDVDDVDILRQCVLNDAPDPIPGQPEAVNAAILRALLKERKDRFSSCREFVAAMTPSDAPPPIQLSFSSPPPRMDIRREKETPPVVKTESSVVKTRAGQDSPREMAWVKWGLVWIAVSAAVIAGMLAQIPFHSPLTPLLYLLIAGVSHIMGMIFCCLCPESVVKRRWRLLGGGGVLLFGAWTLSLLWYWYDGSEWYRPSWLFWMVWNPELTGGMMCVWLIFMLKLAQGTRSRLCSWLAWGVFIYGMILAITSTFVYRYEYIGDPRGINWMLVLGLAVYSLLIVCLWWRIRRMRPVLREDSSRER